jgi:drug/metabolite transporter (DMT)-like permease
MKLNRTSANTILLVITIFWGFAFICTKIALNAGMSAALINLIRGSIFTFLVLLFFFKRIIKMKKREFYVGLAAGFFNFLGFITQTLGADLTSPSNNAFLTVTNVIMVPFIVWAVYRRRPPIRIFIAVIICVYGMAWLTGYSWGYSINEGDVLSLLCAFFFAISIAILGNSAKDCDFAPIAFMLAIIQAVGGLVWFLLIDGASVQGIDWAKAILPILFLAVFSSFIAQSGQVIAQRYTLASTAALIMTSEGVFAAIFSVILGFEEFRIGMLIGGLLIMVSLLVAEFDYKAFRLRGGKSEIKEQ